MSLLLAATLGFGAGLTAQVPDDAAPAVFGLRLTGRYFALEDAFVGLDAGYAGGLVDRNAALNAAGKLEVATQLGYRPRLSEDWALHAQARAGVLRVDGWPRGALKSLAQFGVLAGVEVGATWSAWTMFDHPAGLELSAGLTRLRLNGVWVDAPGATLAAVVDW